MMARLALAAALLLAACSSAPKATTAPKPPDERPAAAPLTAKEVESARIATIEIRGLARIDESRARLAVAARVGGRFDRAAIRESLRKLMAIDGVADARALAFRSAAGKLGLAFAVTESPPVTGVEVTGNQGVADSELLPLVELTPGDFLDPVAATAAAGAMKRRLAAAGYYRAAVEWKAVPGKGGAALRFEVTEGPRAQITKITFPGASALPRARLLSLLAKGAPDNAVGGIYLSDAVEGGALRITSDYYDRGYIEVKVGPHHIETPEPDHIEIEMPIEEGHQYRVGKLEVTGELAAPERAYRRQLETRRGQVFNRSRVAGDIERLTAFHAKKSGESKPVVVPLTTVDPDAHTIDLKFNVAAQ